MRPVVGDLLGTESIERLPVVLPFLQNCHPAQSCLRPFKHQELEEHPVIVHRHTPLLVVIGDRRFGGSPRTAQHCTTFGSCLERGLIHSPLSSLEKSSHPSAAARFN